MAAWKRLFCREFPSTIEAMELVLDGALEALIRDGWVEEATRFRARLCLEEALTNAIKHGNKGDEKKMVRLDIDECGSQCRLRIRDEGGCFCPENAVVPPPDQTGGRGICIMKHYMEKVEYDREKHCLEMVLRRTLCGKEGA